MPDPKRPAEEATDPPQQQVASFIREHQTPDVAVPQNPISSSTALALAIDECDDFLDRWLDRHFSLSVQLHDAQRELARELLAEGPSPSANEVLAVMTDLEIVQGVLFELHGYLEGDRRARAVMHDSRAVQHAVITVYAWLGDALQALPTRSIARRRPSFVDEGEVPGSAMLTTLQRLHPDLERLVRADGVPADEDVRAKLALCFRQIGAGIVRISGRTTTRPPPT
jgi:hypothetical protein